jgi:hypothetical protein
MARARLFKPMFFANAKLSEVSAHGRLLFVSLWTLADREGRLKDEPRVIKGMTFPFENVNVDRLLGQLNDLGFVQRYVVDGEHFVQITKFKKHQRPHQNEPASTLPPMYEVDDAVGEPSTIVTSSGSNSSSGIVDPIAVHSAGAAAPVPAAVHPDLDVSDEHGFALEYIHRFEAKNAKPPSPNEKAAARSLERDFGTEACMQIAADHDWQRHPNWLREALNDPNRGRKLQAAGRANGHRPKPDAADELERRLAAL